MYGRSPGPYVDGSGGAVASNGMDNHFAASGAAVRYARGRPYFHPLVVERIRARIGGSVDCALDVACGTGQSTRALASMAEHAIGVDVAPAMISQASRQPGVSYAIAAAERIPLADGGFSLLTTWSAFHWFRRGPFLQESRRLLRPGGWLVITNDAFTGTTTEPGRFEDWNRHQYLARYPTPKRNWMPLSSEDAASADLVFRDSDSYAREQDFTAPQLVDYLMTQSNVGAVIDSGAETEASARAWLEEGIRTHHQAPRARFLFKGTLHYVQRVA
jgi:SAM-dependent methyltransferase